MKEPLAARPRTLKELSTYYGVSTRTFRRWLTCDALRYIKPERGYYYSINQIKAIIAHIGSCDD